MLLRPQNEFLRKDGVGIFQLFGGALIEVERFLLMTTWYQNTTSGFLEYSLQEAQKSGLFYRMSKFSSDSLLKCCLNGQCANRLWPRIEDSLFGDVRLDSAITSELQNKTVMSDNTDISCYLAAINPLALLLLCVIYSPALVSPLGLNTRLFQIGGVRCMPSQRPITFL